jgi:hypothetical protein
MILKLLLRQTELKAVGKEPNRQSTDNSSVDCNCQIRSAGTFLATQMLMTLLALALLLIVMIFIMFNAASDMVGRELPRSKNIHSEAVTRAKLCGALLANCAQIVYCKLDSTSRLKMSWQHAAMTEVVVLSQLSDSSGLSHGKTHQQSGNSDSSQNDGSFDRITRCLL